MEQQPNENGKQPELPFDETLETPSNDDTFVTYGKQLQYEIQAKPDELRYEYATRAKERIKNHFHEQYGRIILLSSQLAIAIQKGKDGEQNRGVRLTDASVFGEIEGVHVLEAGEHIYLTLQLKDASIHSLDLEDGKIMSTDSNSVALVPICFIAHHELL